MSLIGIGKGLIKTVEGVIEGDGEKIVKGLFKTVKSVIATIIFKGDKDDSSDDIDD